MQLIILFFLLQFQKRFFSSPAFSPSPLLETVFQGEKQFEITIDPAEKPHVIVLFLESFSSHALGFEKKATPNFDRLSQEGILFSNFYSNGTFTYRALIAGLFGVPAGRTTQGLTPYIDVPFVGLPELFKQAGYATAFFHNGSLSYDGQRDFLESHFDFLADRYQMEDAPGSGTSWGVHDEFLMQYTVNWLEKQQKPAFTTLFTISNHHPWITPEHHVSPNFQTHKTVLHQRFLQTTHYTDHALGLLIDLLRQKGLSKKTVLVIVGDHGQPMGQHQGNVYYSRFLYEENVRVPLLIIADGRINNPQTIDEIGSHVDLLPTLTDLLELKGSHSGCGTSLLRKNPDKTAFLHNPYAEGYLGCRKGSWKWIERQVSLVGELYDLEKDPEEKINLVDHHPEVAESLRLETQNYFRSIFDLYEKKKKNPSKEKILPSLDISTTLITDEELIQQLDPNLEKLNLRDCLLLTDRGIAGVLSQCTYLEELNLKGITDLDGTFAQDLHLPRLRGLDISDAPISDRGIQEIIQACTHLSVLSLKGEHLTDEGLKALSRSHQLVHLKIFQGKQLSEEGLINVIRNHPHLVQLVLHGCVQLTDQFLKAIQQHPLELLSITDAPLLTDEGLSYLQEMPLRFLTIEGCPQLSQLPQMNLERAMLNSQSFFHT